MKNIVAERKHAKRQRYKPDLSELLSQCELNYLLFFRCWPDFLARMANEEYSSQESSGNKREWFAKSNSVWLQFRVTERAKYTTTVRLLVTTVSLKSNQDIELIVRLYHDAKMLEVMEGSGPAALKAIYRAETNNLKSTDEKRQANRFVGECLKAVSA